MQCAYILTSASSRDCCTAQAGGTVPAAVFKSLPACLQCHGLTVKCGLVGRSSSRASWLNTDSMACVAYLCINCTQCDSSTPNLSFWMQFNWLGNDRYSSHPTGCTSTCPSKPHDSYVNVPLEELKSSLLADLQTSISYSLSAGRAQCRMIWPHLPCTLS